MFWNTIVKMTTNVANIPPIKIAKPRIGACSGASGKLLDKQNVTKKNVDEGPAILTH